LTKETVSVFELKSTLRYGILLGSINELEQSSFVARKYFTSYKLTTCTIENISYHLLMELQELLEFHLFEFQFQAHLGLS
jgi:hypothetical protein